ncbi:MAG: hypothetical protein WDZ90_02600 [Candidatus Paceibacterota bacterium]
MTIVFVVFGSFGIPDKKIHAQAEAVVVVGGPGTIPETLSSAFNEITSFSTFSSDFKEMILDPLAWQIAKAIRDEITRSIVTWINSGFDGNPAFVEDLDGFLRGVGDRAAGQFIEQELGLGFICSPFQLDIQIALALDYYSPFRDRAACTLSDVVDNIDGFFGGDFRDGGWKAWYAVTTNPHNNPYGAYIAAKGELAANVRNARGEQVQLLNFGGGFLSFEQCDDVGSTSSELAQSGPLGGFGGPGPQGTGVESQNCRITTPGAVIEGQLENVLGSGIRELELADEFDEIIGALIGQLLNQVLGGPGGLSGVSQSSASSPSYFERVDSQQQSNLSSVKSEARERIERVINDEEAYLLAKESSLGFLSSTQTVWKEVHACFIQKATTLSGSNKTEAENRAAHATSTISSIIAPRKEAIENDAQDAIANIAELESVLDAIEQAETASETNELAKYFNNIFQGRTTLTLHNPGDVILAENERNNLEKEMNSLKAEANSELAACEVFPNEVESNQGTER